MKTGINLARIRNALEAKKLVGFNTAVAGSRAGTAKRGNTKQGTTKTGNVKFGVTKLSLKA
jgi:hypothetical protein